MASVTKPGIPEKTLHGNFRKNVRQCVYCGKVYDSVTKWFYSTKSPLFEYNGKRCVICKTCLAKLYRLYTEISGGDKHAAFYWICSKTGWYYDRNSFDLIENMTDIFSAYTSKNNVGPCKGKSFEDNISEELKSPADRQDLAEDFVEDYYKARETTVSLIGYDPFKSENETDKAHLYRELENLLDEATVEDPFKLACVVQIVKNFGQIEHINKRIAMLLTDDSSSADELKALISAKDSLYTKTLSMARDNGISVINSVGKAKGAGTLSGKIKELYELGIEEAFVNSFDIETSTAMRQVADISSGVIYEKLRLDENEYTDIITHQRKLLEHKEGKLAESEENLRRLKVELAKVKKHENMANNGENK